MKIKLTLPYPPSELLPNKHTHWTVKAKATREAREMAFYLAVQHRDLNREPMTSVALDITWYPPKGNAADYDSILTATKPLIDGGLVDTGIIKDDKPKVIKIVSLHMGEAAESPYTEIIIEEV